MDEKAIKMTTQPVEGLIAKLALPSIISMLVTTFYNMADTYFVSTMNNTSVTGAVGVVFSLMAIIQAFGFFFGHGSGNYISRSMGAGDRRTSEIVASIGFFGAFIVGCIIMILGLAFKEKLAYMLGATETIYPYAKEYMTYILFGAPFMCASLVINNQLRFQGNASFAMVGITTGAILNCILDPLLITTFKMGIRGAAIATITGQFVSFVLLLWGAHRSDNVKISIKNFVPKSKYLLKILNGGFPSLCRQGISSLGTIYLNHIAGGYGDFAITGMTICSRVIMFLNSAMIGFGQGFQPVCGYNYGAKKYDRVAKAFWFCVKSSFAFLVVVSLCGALFAENIVKMFSEDLLVIKFGSATFRAMCIAFPLNSWIVMSNMTLQTTGKAVRASIIAAARQGIVLVPVMFIMNSLFKLNGLVYTQMVSDIITFLIAVPFQMSFLKEIRTEVANSDNL